MTTLTNQPLNIDKLITQFIYKQVREKPGARGVPVSRQYSSGPSSPHVFEADIALWGIRDQTRRIVISWYDKSFKLHFRAVSCSWKISLNFLVDKTLYFDLHHCNWNALQVSFRGKYSLEMFDQIEGGVQREWLLVLDWWRYMTEQKQQP